MKIFNLILIFSLFVIISCSPSRYSTDWDPEINFSNYKTFKIYKGKKPDDDALRKNRLVEKRVEKAVEDNLTGKGYILDKDEVDFIIILHAGTQKKANMATTVSVGYGYGPYGYGGYGHGWGMGSGVTSFNTSTEATLFIDIIDYKSKDLAWRGTGTEVIYNYTNKDEMNTFIGEVVNDILEDFPPEGNN